MKVVHFEQTCHACPSQWEGHIEDGRMFYCRYRWGKLTIELSKEPTEDVFKAMNEYADMIHEKEYGGEFDGLMETNYLKKIMLENGFEF